MSNQPPYQNWPPDPSAPQPSGPTYPSYPESGTQGYGQSGAGYAPPPGYGQSGSGYTSPPAYGQSAQGGYGSPSGSGYGQSAPGYTPPNVGYGQPIYPGTMYVQPIPDPGKGMAIAGFVLGIISICLLCLTTVGAVANLVVATLGIIFSLIGRKSTTSHGLAIAGLVLSIIGVVVSAIFFLILIGLLASFSHATY